MTTKTLVSEIALSVALVKIASSESSYAADLAEFAARHVLPSSEPLDLAVGRWLAHGWIEQDTTSDIAELRRGDRLELAGGDFEAIRAVFSAVYSEEEEEAEEKQNAFQDAVEDAARDFYRSHYEAMHAAHALGAEHGAEHADSWVSDWRREPTNPNDPEREPTDEEIRADYRSAIKTLERMSTTANDWSTSAAEAWSLTGREETTSGEPEHIQEQIRYWYVAGYESGACKRSGELADELFSEQMRDEFANE